MSSPALIELPESCCGEGDLDLEHCHGTAVVHLTGRHDCLDDPDCRVIAEVHAFVISCTELGCDCA